MKFFNKLYDALEHAGGPTRSVYQCGIPAKKFIVASEREFYNNCMRGVVQRDRNFYEVIRADTPCDLHLDLDMDYTKHPSINIEDVWNTIKPFIFRCIERMTHEIEECIVLDSSNDKKGSYHIIYKLKDHLFASNANCGAFLRCLYKKRIKPNPEIKFIWDNFVDMGIYTRNRLFRMLSCTKKSDPSRILRWEGHPCSFETWRKCKVQPVISSKEMIECEEPDGNPAKYTTSVLNGTSDVSRIFYDTVKEFSNTLGPVRRIFSMRKLGLYTITLENKFCVFKNDYHSKNTNYVVVDLICGTYHYKCWSNKHQCKNAYSGRKDLPPSIMGPLKTMRNFKISPSIC